MGWNGPGPYKIVNNRLEGAHENIAFGGADPSINGLIPADMEIRKNYVIKPIAWKGVWTAKNLIEFKAGRRVLIEGNVFENNWVDGQNGFAFLWQTTNQDGGCTWCATSDVTFRSNVVRNVAGGFNLSVFGSGSNGTVNTAVPLQRVTITNNVITGLDASNGRLYQILGNVAGLTISNNSGMGVAHDLLFGTPDVPIPTLVFRNNITGAQYTLFASGAGMGTPALVQLGIPAANVTGNVLAAGSGPSSVPAGNSYVASPSAIGFVNYAGGDLTLAASSPFVSSGTGGSQPGADFSGVRQTIASVAQ